MEQGIGGVRIKRLAFQSWSEVPSLTLGFEPDARDEILRMGHIGGRSARKSNSRFGLRHRFPGIDFE